MSLYWRFLGAFVLLILFAVSLSVGIGYYATLDRLDTYGGELSSKAAELVAQKLGQSYTYSDGWETLVVTVSEAGSGSLIRFKERTRATTTKTMCKGSTMCCSIKG